MIWDLTCYFRIWLFSYIFGEFGLLLLLIRLSWTILKYALYYFQITFSSFELVICPSKLSKLCFLLDFKCFYPRNLIEKLISFGIMWKFNMVLFEHKAETHMSCSSTAPAGNNIFASDQKRVALYGNYTDQSDKSKVIKKRLKNWRCFDYVSWLLRVSDITQDTRKYWPSCRRQFLVKFSPKKPKIV